MLNLIEKYGEKILCASVLVAVLIVGIISRIQPDILTANALVASSSNEISDFYIKPSIVTIDIGQSYTFYSYGIVSTGEVHLVSDWNIESGENFIEQGACQYLNNSCTIKAKKTGNVVLEAEYNGKTDTTYITITNDVVDSSVNSSGDNNPVSSSDPKFYVEPSETTISLGMYYDFVSYAEYSTGAVQIESVWSLDKPDLAELHDCNGSACRVYAGVESGDVVLTAKAKVGDQYKESSSIISIAGRLKNPFSDEIPDWAEEEIIQLYSRDIISGYNDGRYGASDPVTRGQFVLLVQRLLKYMNLYDSDALDNENCNIFDDVKSDHYAYQAICYANKFGWLDIVPSDSRNFRPDEPSTRGVTSYTILSSILDDLLEELSMDESVIKSYGYEFIDVPANHKYALSIGAVNFYEIMTGQGDGTKFEPDKTLNRAEAAVVLWRIKNALK